MIKLNLLPQEYSSKAAAGAPAGPPQGGSVMVGAILAAVYIVILGLAGLIFWQLMQSNAAVQRAKTDFARVDGERKKLLEEFNEIKELEDALRSQVAVLDSLNPKDRIFWAKKMNMLPSIVPDGLYMTDVKLSEKTQEVETKASRDAQAAYAKQRGKKGPPPARQMRTIITYQVVMNAVAYVPDGTSDARLALIIQLLQNMQNKEVRLEFNNTTERFLDGMDQRVQISKIEQATIANREVSRVTLTLNTLPPPADGI